VHHRVCVCVCVVLLGNFDFDVDIVVSEAVAADSGDSLPGETDPLVRLDACGNLERKTCRFDSPAPPLPSVEEASQSDTLTNPNCYRPAGCFLAWLTPPSVYECVYE